MPAGLMEVGVEKNGLLSVNPELRQWQAYLPEVIWSAALLQ